MRALVTCGPSFEPIDEVRRLTNFSTGEIGTILSDTLTAVGVDTVCLRGVGTTFPQLPRSARVIPFTTNDDLASKLASLAAEGPWDLVCHAAALADYRLAAMLDDEGKEIQGAKIRTGTGGVTLRLASATKLLPRFRDWFPAAQIVGWKYEMDGSREQAIKRGRQQIEKCRTDACVVNGRAYGSGFGLLRADSSLTAWPDKQTLAQHLVESFCHN